METTLLSLPWQLQLSLASGYAAYHVANIGIRTHHKAVDVAFSTLLFGLCATLIYNAMVWFAPDSMPLAVVSAIFAFATTTLLGGVWRKSGRPFLKNIFRKLKVSFSDDDPSVLATLSADVDHLMTSVAVRLDDGRWLRCDDTALFSDKPFGPCILAPDGGVAIYVTHVESGDRTIKLTSTVDDDFGDRLTFVPASRVSQVNARYIKKPPEND